MKNTTVEQRLNKPIWEKTLKSTLFLNGDDPIEVIFSGGVSKTIRQIPWSMFTIAMNTLIHSETDRAVKSQLQSIIKNRTDDLFHTIDYDGVAEDVIRLVEEK